MTRAQRAFRRKLATFFVALYAFCVLAPHAALALAQTAGAAHCLTQASDTSHQHAAKSSHVHEEGVAHDLVQAAKADEFAKAQPSSKAGEAGAQTACCGVFCVIALAVDTAPLFIAATPGQTMTLPAPDGLTGHPPANLTEPPIA